MPDQPPQGPPPQGPPPQGSQGPPPQGPPPQGPPPRSDSGGSGPSQPPGNHRRNLILIAVGAGVLALVLIAVVVGTTGGGDVETVDGEVVNAEEFLTSLTSDWESSLPSDNVTVTDDPTCYFVLDGEELAGSVVACGTVRRAGIDETRVWDLFAVDYEQTSEGLEAFIVGDGGISAARPRGTLVDADGDEPPDDIEALEAPPLPQADSGLIMEVAPESVSVRDEVSPGEAGRIISPAGVLEVTTIATAESIPTLDMDEEGVEADAQDIPFGPAEGEVFKVVSGTFLPTSSDDLTAELSRVSNGEQQRIMQFASAGYDAPEEQAFRVLLSVPADGAQLSLTSEGHGQSLDLATGERIADPVADTYYRTVTSQEIGRELTIPSRQVSLAGERDEVSMYAFVNSVTLSPYSPTQGWAKAGRAWLLVDFDSAMESSGYYFQTDTVSFDWYATVDGKELPKGRIAGLEDGSNEGLVGGVDVPASTTSAQLRLDVDLRLENYYNDRTKGADFDAEPFTVKFPE